ncbi:FAS1-like dehydratase domain-containing protein [Nesterenkonia ebinurensis]|uniref:FAS1-like dehydratase domain-containing protein n=1 Tax=Nesterenkonia ebinurensis TaxID=2608252 RepID=UPI00123D3767|nr:MaoC family dehydratase N-terminal domain-containing protein [Nesterenkonia ebinurensis]
MSINTAREGHSYPPIEYQVGREEIREFATAVKAEHRAHHSEEAAAQLGHHDLIAPPTFAVVIAQRAEAAAVTDPEAGIDFSRVVHAEERFTHHAPITAGETLTAATTLDRIRVMGAGAMVTTITEITTKHDAAPRATVTSTLLVRGDDEEEG